MRGVYLVAAELTRRGLVVSPTLRNASGADLLATDPECRRAWSVQVKTNTDRNPCWLVGERAKTTASPSHVYVFVTLEGKQGLEYLAVSSGFVASHVDEDQHKSGTFFSFDRRKLEPNYDGWKIFQVPEPSSD
jgi:hypothetical protein